MKTNRTIFPRLESILAQVGENIKLARLRRRFSTRSMAERSGISRSTLSLIEKGSDSVSIGAYIQVMFILGLENDFLNLAKDDILGRKIQDAGLIVKKRVYKERVKK